MLRQEMCRSACQSVRPSVRQTVWPLAKEKEEGEEEGEEEAAAVSLCVGERVWSACIFCGGRIDVAVVRLQSAEPTIAFGRPLPLSFSLFSPSLLNMRF